MNELVCKNEDSDSNDGEEESQEDPIAAAQPLVVFTHSRNSTLNNTHITAFCQGFGREAPILLFEDTRPELQRIQVFCTLVNNYPSIKVFAGRSAGARNAAKASSRSLPSCQHASKLTFISPRPCQALNLLHLCPSQRSRIPLRRSPCSRSRHRSPLHSRTWRPIGCRNAPPRSPQPHACEVLVDKTD